jgi:trafficking protein particle complex subunit 2
MAYYFSVSNPFLKLEGSKENGGEQSSLLGVGSSKWNNFMRRIDEISRVVGTVNSTNTSVTPL